MFAKTVANTIYSCTRKSYHVIPSNYVKNSLFLLNTKIGVRYAGSAKWQNIKHTKASKDLQKNQLYNRHIDDIKRFVREGKNCNPKSNLRLAKAIETAKKEGVAMTTITGVLQKLEKSMLNPKPIVYEYRGPSGVLVIISANTDNKSRTRGEINYFTKRHGLVKAENLRSAFNHKGFVYAKPPPDVTNPDEKAVEDGIEIGAEEVDRDEENPDLLVFSCDAADCNTIRSKLESRNYQIEDSEEVYLPRSTIELSEEDTKKIHEGFEKIDEIPEVNGIFTNLA